MTGPRASIIITTHNRPERLRRAIASALVAARDVEIIVIDDASADETARTCAAIAEIKYVRVERNQGVAGARNVGLIASCGEFITFLDDDDLRLPGSLDEQIDALAKSPAAMMCYAQAIPQDDAGNRQPPFPAVCPNGDLFPDLLTRNFIPCGSVLFRRECIVRVGLLNDSIARIDDWDLWLRIAELYPAVSLNRPVIVWRQATTDSRQGSSNTLDVINLSITHFRARCLRMARMKNASPRERREAWRSFSLNIAEHLAWETFRSLRAGQLNRTIESTRTLLRLHPATFMYLIRVWASASAIKMLLANHDDLETAKHQLKKIRYPTTHENYPVQEPP